MCSPAPKNRYHDGPPKIIATCAIEAVKLKQPAISFQKDTRHIEKIIVNVFKEEFKPSLQKPLPSLNFDKAEEHLGQPNFTFIFS